MKHLPILALALPLGLLASCSTQASPDVATGTNGPVTVTTGTAQLLVAASDYPDMFGFQAGIDEVRLVDRDGVATENLLAAPQQVELAGTQDRALWLTNGEVPAGEYTSMEVVFDPAGLETMDLGGRKAPVDVPEPRWAQEFDSPVTIAEGGLERLWIALDLEASLRGSPSAPPVAFHPMGEVFASSEGDEPVDEFRGLVLRGSAERSAFSVHAFRRGERLGEIVVSVTEDTMLIDDTGVEFADADAFFASLRPQMTVVEIHGEFVGDGPEVVAKRVEIVDQGGGPGSPPFVEIEGRVLHIDRAANFFVLLMREIEEGADVAVPVLRRLGSPSSIDVHFDRGTEFRLQTGRVVTPAELRVGQIVDCRFSEFGRPPFVADRVEIEVRGRCVSGEVVSVENSPRAIVIAVGHDHVTDERPSTSAAGPVRPVTVLLADAKVFVGVHGRPQVRPGAILPGMRVTACGEFSRSEETGLVLAAEWLRIRPGFLIKGKVSATHPETSRFALSEGKVVIPFGDTVDGPPFGVGIDPQARIRGDASTEAQFFRLFNALGDEEYLDVKVRGIATEERAEIRAFELKAKVRKLRPDDGGEPTDEEDPGDEGGPHTGQPDGPPADGGTVTGNPI